VELTYTGNRDVNQRWTRLGHGPRNALQLGEERLHGFSVLTTSMLPAFMMLRLIVAELAFFLTIRRRFAACVYKCKVM